MLLANLVTSMILFGSPSPAVSQSGETYRNNLNEVIARSLRSYNISSNGYTASQPGKFDFKVSSSARLHLNEISAAVTAFGNGNVSNLAGAATSRTSTDANGWPKLTFNRSNLSEWFVNERNGLHHWMQVNKKSGAGDLWVKLAVTTPGALRQVSDSQVEVSGKDRTFSYAGLKVWDAKGTYLDARMKVSGTAIYLVVDDAKASYPVTIDPTWIQESKLTASDAATTDAFGTSVAIDGDRAIVGAPTNDAGGTLDSGAAYVYFRGTNGLWSQEAKLIASDKTGSDFFGTSVSISGVRAVVGATGQDASANAAGAAYVFTRSGTTWTQEAKLLASDGASNNNMGASVSTTGDRIAVGSPGAKGGNVNNAGQVYIYARAIAGTWSQEAILNASDRSVADGLGISVSLSGDYVLAGANLKGNSNIGGAYVWVRALNGTWSQQAIIVGSDSTPDDQFGTSVSLSGDRAVIGAPLKNQTVFTDAGAVYAFTRSGTVWTEEARIVAGDVASGALFGNSVSISGSRAIIGSSAATVNAAARGAAYVFLRDGAGAWSQEVKFTGSDSAASDAFGTSVSISGVRAIVGANGNDPSAVSNAGAAYAFQVTETMSLSFPTVGVIGGRSSTGTVTLGVAPAVDTVITLSSNSAALQVPASVTVLAGNTTATFVATSSVTLVDTLGTVSAAGTGYANASTTLDVRLPRVGAMSFSSPVVAIGQSATGTVTLQAAAPTGGILVSLANDAPATLSCPASVLVPAGQTRATFTVVGQSVAVASSAKVTGTPSFTEKSATISVLPYFLADFTIQNTTILASTSTVGTVTVSSPAPAGGSVITLSSSTNRLTLPSTVTVPEGATSAQFTIAGGALPVSAGVIRAALGTVTKAATINVVHRHITAVALGSTTITSGNTTTFTVTVNATAASDMVVTLSSQSPSIAGVPATLTIPAGQTSASVTVTTTAGVVGTSNIYANLPGHGVKGAKLTVN